MSDFLVETGRFGDARYIGFVPPLVGRTAVEVTDAVREYYLRLQRVSTVIFERADYETSDGRPSNTMILVDVLQYSSPEYANQADDYVSEAAGVARQALVSMGYSADILPVPKDYSQELPFALQTELQ